MNRWFVKAEVYALFLLIICATIIALVLGIEEALVFVGLMTIAMVIISIMIYMFID